MNLFRVLAAASVLAALPAGAAETSAEVGKIVGAAYAGHALDDLLELTDKYGPRVTGSPLYEQAVDWAMAKFTAIGLKVHTESFTLKHSWQRGPITARLVAPVEKALHVESYGWSIPTPADGLTAEVLVLHDDSAEAIAKEAANMRGKIVLVDKATLSPLTTRTQVRFMRAVPLFEKNGAVAFAFEGRAPNDVLGTGEILWGELLPIPGFVIGQEDFIAIERMAGKGPVKLNVNLKATIGGPTPVRFVVAELRGRDKPEEYLVVGAHLDAWDFATGAQDDGAGVVQVIDAARSLVAAGKAPRRSIRFILWGGEEQGLLASRAYVVAHKAELDKCFVNLNADNGAGHPRGWTYEGREDQRAALAAYHDTLAPLGGGELMEDVEWDTDHGPFLTAGVPAINMSVEDGNYNEIHHKPADTYDKVNAHDLAGGTALLAVTAWKLAEADKFVPHLDRAALMPIVQKDGLDELLKLLGDW
jgi:hypothetical protein